MPIGLRAAALRAALERALDEPVHALSTDRGVRIHAPAPAPDDSRWARIYSVLNQGDVWGSSYTPMGPEVWAEIHEVSA